MSQGGQVGQVGRAAQAGSGMARSNGATRLAALGVRPHARTAPALPPTQDSLLDALLDGIPDGVVLCDRWLAPVRASASARWLVAPEGGWADSAAAGACREAAAAALDRGGMATLDVTVGSERWEVRAAPLAHPEARVCVTLRPEVEGLRECVLRAAHDLKAPLHAAGAYATLLLREAAGPLAPTQRQMVETIDTEAGRLRAQLEGVLERVRTGEAGGRDLPETDAPGPGVCDLGAVIEHVLERFAGTAALRGVRLEGAQGEPAIARLPEGDARTILENLVANALAAVPPGGTVRVCVEGPEGEGVVRCRVEDDGPGIPQALHERVFAPHFRIPGQGERGGTGLGLTISRGLAERAGGSLVVADRAGGGAVFTLAVPAAHAGAAARLRLAPVTSHRALAHVQRTLDGAGGRAWRLIAWEEGAVTVEMDGAQGAAAQVGELLTGSGVVCWEV